MEHHETVAFGTLHVQMRCRKVQQLFPHRSSSDRPEHAGQTDLTASGENYATVRNRCCPFKRRVIVWLPRFVRIVR